ncbi:MAG: hypothetical protein RL605_1058, partial [Actinomycetota bacterium]
MILTGGQATVLVGLELPGLLDRIEKLKHGCVLAAEHYFGGEHAIANRLTANERVDVPALAVDALAGANQVGLLKESQIEISRIGFAGAVVAPHSVVELAMRLQQTSSDGDLGGQAEFRIDRFEHHVIVYIPGTKEWSAKAGDNPLDLTSNVHAIGSESDGSATP